MLNYYFFKFKIILQWCFVFVVAELFVLLGLCSICSLFQQSSTLHATRWSFTQSLCWWQCC